MSQSTEMKQSLCGVLICDFYTQLFGNYFNIMKLQNKWVVVVKEFV